MLHNQRDEESVNPSKEVFGHLNGAFIVHEFTWVKWAGLRIRQIWTLWPEIESNHMVECSLFSITLPKLQNLELLYNAECTLHCASLHCTQHCTSLQFTTVQSGNFPGEKEKVKI